MNCYLILKAPNYSFSRLTFLLMFAALIQTGCKKSDWYDIKSDKSLVVPSTLGDMQALLDNADFLNIYTPGLGEAGSDGHYLPDAIITSLSVNDRNAYTWSDNAPFYSRVPDWSGGTLGGYVRVLYSNVVLDGLENISAEGNTDRNQWNYIKGQALFLRARSFYELSQVFAPPYDSSSASTDLGIPLRLTSDINIPSKRSNLQQTYDQIIGDLILARSLLPQNSLPIDAISKARPTLVAIFGLLARIYLSVGNYTHAGNYADSALRLYNTLLDYNNPADVDLAGFRPIATLNNEVIFHTTMAYYTTTDINQLLIDPALYSQFDSNDLRKVGNFTLDSTTGNIGFKGTYSGTSDPFTGLTTGEIYLIRAECLARAGNTIKAMADLNTLLQKRYDQTFIPFSTTNADSALVMILNERKKELLLRGIRWSDLRRLNRDDRFKVTIIRIAGGQTYTLDPGSFRYTLPIPTDVINLSNIQQNRGW